MKKILLALLFSLISFPAFAQITVPNTFVTGTRILASEMNANFDTLESDSLNRTGGTITGNIVVNAGVTIDGIDIGAVLGGTGTPTFASLTVTGAGTFGTTLGVTGDVTVNTNKFTVTAASGNTLVAGTLTTGSGAVQLTTAGGKLQAFTSTYIDNLSGAAITSLDAGNISTGLLAIARGGTNGAAVPTAGAVAYGTGTAYAFSAAGTQTTQYLVSGGTGSPTWANRPMILIGEGEGSSTSAVAANVDTVSISGLGSNDQLIVKYVIRAVGGDVAGVYLYNNTDSVSFGELNDQSGSGNMLSGTTIVGETQSVLVPNSSVLVGTYTKAITIANSGRNQGNSGTFTTNYVNPWTLALRMGGITAGTFYFKWQVFRVVGT